jgi:putative ABC transport system permease protein
MLRALSFAWLTSVRQPARTGLGVLGVTAVGALLFDMLMLSHGLVLSFRDLLDRAGFDVRVLATDATPLTGPRIAGARAIAAVISALPQVEDVLETRVGDAEIATGGDLNGSDAGAVRRTGESGRVGFIGADPAARPMWAILEGRDLAIAAASPPLLVNRNMARTLSIAPGSTLVLRGTCAADRQALPPVSFTVVGIAEFPFDDASAATVGGRLSDLARLCGDEGAAEDRADMLLVRSNPRDGADVAAAAIRAVRPGLHVVTNEEIVERFSEVDFSYFRQISFVLATVTVFFGFLLIAVLLTVSVNQRLGEIAALRAVGLSRSRVVAGVLWESVIMVGVGGTLAVPVGAALSIWLDGILRALPGIPTGVHFLVFEPQALVVYAWLLTAAALGAAAYPMRTVAVLPIAATLRREVVS